MICRWLLPYLSPYTTVYTGILVRYDADFLFLKGVFKVFLSVLQVFIQNPGGPDSAWNLPDELSVGQAVQIRVSPEGSSLRRKIKLLSNKIDL